MSLPSELSRQIRLYVTHVDGDGHFLRISGQLDKQAPMMIESLFEIARETLESGVGTPTLATLHEGIICAAKYKDGVYYRAKIINTSGLATGLVGVHFIDYGNKDKISISAIRLLDTYDAMFLKLRGQATDYYLSKFMNPSTTWEERIVLKLQSLICYTEYTGVIDAETRPFPLISLAFNGGDLSAHLVSIRLGMAIPIAKQEVLLLQLCREGQQGHHWQPSLNIESPSFTEHVPFLINQNFPSNPASAMRLQQVLPFNGSIPPPNYIPIHKFAKAPRNPVNLKPARQLATAASNETPALRIPSTSPPSKSANIASKPSSPKKSNTYKSRLLEVNSQHTVFICCAEEGPELFAAQLVADTKKLQDMMDEINKRPHKCLTEPPMIGSICLGRMSEERIICRAIVMNHSGLQCKLFFVDFGDTEMVSYYDIFDIPEEFVKPNVFAMRFCLSGVKKLEKGPHLVQAFKQLVKGKVMTLKVVPAEGPPLIQYGELYLNNKNILELLLTYMKDNLQFKCVHMLPLETTHSVLVSYVDSCIKFYVQLSDNIEDLNGVMAAVKAHCESTTSPGAFPDGAACCARFPDDGNWYRAKVRSTRNSRVVVKYVDYGNEQEVDVSDLRTITPDLLKLPAQAMKCALKGFENKPVETKTSNQLEMLALEKTLLAHIVGMLSSDTMLVSLVDDTVSPPLDVARKMNQLSQPRSSHEIKVTTPVRKDAPESFSSPESNSDDGRKKNIRREKSFKDERRSPRDGNEEFSHRGGSFRGRDNKDNFDRSAPARHSDKYAGKPDRGDRRGGPKPWENNTSPPANKNKDDEWEETTSQPNFQASSPQKPQRDNYRDRRKPRPGEHQQEKGPRPGWKGKETGGVGKRLRQAADAVSTTDPQSQTSNQKPNSIQDRLKRDNRFNRDEREDRKDDWGNKTGGRPDRRDNRGDNRNGGRENWGDRRENNPRRDFKDRNDRPRSNFTPRERAEKPDRHSDSDRRSERSNRSQDSGGLSVGRGHQFQPRSRFTQVQYKELPDPVPLTSQFEDPIVEAGSQHEVSVTWIISPESFYTQILSLQPKFLDMMHNIPELYKGVRSFSGDIPVGASVLARYPADGVLYRATVVSVQPFSKFIVRYIDFGNKQLVDAKDIWQIDKSLMDLPKMAVHCTLTGVMPKDGEWKADPEIDLCFNAPRYQCIFQECVDELYKVSLWNNGVNVADMLVEKELAKMSEQQSSVTLKDEAIDLTIIVGQQIVCRVTHVESYEKFYVQLDMEKATLVENAIATFDTAKLTSLSADSLAEGVHCTAKSGGKIYRAILENVDDHENIVAVLPDYGNTITTSLDNLMILPSELSVYYYQSLQCSLNNYNAESKTLMSLEDLKALTGNKFIIYINDVEGICLVSTLYDVETGHKMSIFEPDEGAYDEVVQLCTRSVFNYNFGMAYICHTENLNEIYLQKATDGDRIAQLLDDLYKFYEEGAPEALTSFEVDGLCAVKSADSNWYRATILNVEETTVKVQFTDYGNTEEVPKDSIKILDPKFYEPCALALVCSLGLVALQDDTLAKLTEWTTEKEVQVTLAFGTDGWLASLHLDGVDLGIKLVNEKLATPQITSNEEEKVEPPVEEPISLPEGCTQVYISHIDTPGHFWLQMLDKIDKIEEIQAELQANADSYADIENREMGTLCGAKYLADDLWYRAEILDSDSDITTVRFIDYGNTDVLDNQPGLIKSLPDHLKEIERYAIKSSVNAVPTGTGQWSEPASDYFTQLVGDISAPVDALIVLKDVTTYVDIYVNGQNLTDKLVAEGHATRSEVTECGDLPSCFASHVNSPSEFWIQLETATSELQAMEGAMVDAENFPELTEKEEGVICAAKYPEDGSWYRAQVIVDGSEGTEVLFMDYGNASIANELRSLPEDLKLKPALSRKCALQKPRDIKLWSRKSEIRFNELAAEGATIFNVQFIASGDISIVELYLEGKSVTEELVGLCDEISVSERPTPVGQDLYNNGKVCFVNSVEEFYVQLDDSIDELDKVMEKMGNAVEFEAITELKVGSVCAALWSEDEQWYRARILEFCDVGYHVQFIDFGNKARCEEFRQLPADLALLEPLAKCCRLAGIPTDTAVRENGRNKLDDFAAEMITFQIEFLDSTKEPILVKMFMDGTDIVSTILLDNANVKKQDNETEENISKENDEVADSNKIQEEIESQEPDDIDEFNASHCDLNESFESNHTVIENKSFGDDSDNINNDISIHDMVKSVESSVEQDSSEILEKSDDTIETPKSEETTVTLETETDSDINESPNKCESPIKSQTPSPVKETIVEETPELKNDTNKTTVLQQSSEDLKKDTAEENITVIEQKSVEIHDETDKTTVIEENSVEIKNGTDDKTSVIGDKEIGLKNGTDGTTVIDECSVKTKNAVENTSVLKEPEALKKETCAPEPKVETSTANEQVIKNNDD